MKCGENRPDVEYVLSLSYGKDSIATIEACKRLGQRIDRIVHAEVWATQDIPAELPPMVEFKEKADKIIYDMYGLRVERVCAMKKNAGVFNEPCEWADKLSYEDYFYAKPRQRKNKGYVGKCFGFPIRQGSWCKKLKYGGWLKTDISRPILQAISTKESGGYRIRGFAQIKGNWCTSDLKTAALRIPKTKRGMVQATQIRCGTGFRTRSEDGVTDSKQKICDQQDASG